MRFVVFSDLHLDAPFAWARPEAARALRRELRAALSRIVELARARGADAILCAGDLYEHDRASADTAEFLRHSFAGAPCRVIVAPGNHDPVVPGSLYERVAWPDNVHIFRTGALKPLALSDHVALWGAAHVAARDTPGFFEDGFRAAGPGVHLGLFHGSERAFLAAEGRDKVGYAPFAADQIPAAGLDHAFVGHYHTPRYAERFTYPGAPAFLSFGVPAGSAVVADVEENGGVAREAVSVASVEAHDLDVDLTGATTADSARQRVGEALAGLTGIARVSLCGEIPAAMELRPDDVSLAALGDAAGGLLDLRVRADRLATAFDVSAIAGEPTVRGEFVRRVMDADLDDETRSQVLAAGLRALAGRDDLEVVP